MSLTPTLSWKEREEKRANHTACIGTVLLPLPLGEDCLARDGRRERRAHHSKTPPLHNSNSPYFSNFLVNPPLPSSR